MDCVLDILQLRDFMVSVVDLSIEAVLNFLFG